MEEITREHPSFAQISFSRVSSNKPRPLYGSSIKCTNTIRVTIQASEEKRNLHQFWYHARKTYIEVELSPVQFAEAITNMNCEGIPCTLQYLDGMKVEECPTESVHDLFNVELKQDLKGIMQDADSLMSQAKALLGAKGTVSQAAKKCLLEMIEKIQREVYSNIPFLHKQVAAQMNKTVHEAKGELDAHVTHMVTQLGQEALKLRTQFELPLLDTKIEEEDQE